VKLHGEGVLLKIVFESETNVDPVRGYVKPGSVDIDFQQFWPTFLIEVIVIVCHCHRVSDRHIRSAVADGARDLTSVSRACGAGSSCGGCRPEVAQVIADELGEGDQTATQPLLRVLRAG